MKQNKDGKWETIHNGVKVTASTQWYLKKKIERMNGETGESPVQAEAEDMRWDVKQRFEFTANLVNMVAKGLTPSAIITGDSGLGKSYTVMQTLAKSGLDDVTEIAEDDVGADFQDEITPLSTYRVVKGFSTARGLYRTLYMNRNNLVVFDDCDSILRDQEALNILKGALDSYDRRTISWNTAFSSDGIPRTFTFNGGIIFISNLSRDRIDNAIKTRSMCVDLSMSTTQKIERMRDIAKSKGFYPQFTYEVKQDSLKLIEQHAAKIRNLSLRTLVTVMKVRHNGQSDWQELATYMMSN